ncbi:MAG TPA: HAMP domain-containing sensor histidine kinase [Myxococcaceae bacterium]|nr:HAMP domain-containing sensor histidine kinase [Myxococcaceae bacterium]
MIGRAQTAWMPVIVAALVSGVLLTATYFIRRSVHDSSYLIARGMGEVFFLSGWERLGGEAYPPTPEALRQFLDAHAADGLRYVGLVDEKGEISGSAGEAVGSGLDDGVKLFGDRARLVARLRPRRPPGLPPPRPTTENPAEPRRRLPRIVYEFEPLTAIELRGRARALSVVAGLSCLGVLGLAIALSRTLRQSEKLRGELEQGRRLAALGSMSAVLAHEIRNPLASLKGHAQLLAETLEKDPRLGAKVDRIVAEAVRLERLTNNLLDFVKTGELNRAPTDPALVLRAAAKATGGARIEVAALPTRSALLDAERLQQALENVLRNAVQASTEKVQASLQRSNGTLIFTVRDQGPGIPAGDEERIFEPFVTGRTQGVGLGLAIAKRIVELHGGRMAARNRREGGAEFEIRIPAKEA